MQLYLFRVDASRVHVESAQLARSLLHQIAEDLRATCFHPATKTTTQTTTPASSGSSSEATDSTAPASGAVGDGASDSRSSSVDANAMGLVGTATELRLNRTANWSWQRAMRKVEADENSSEADTPFSVRYFVREGEVFSAEQLAAEGVNEKLPENIAGLCRERSMVSQETVDPKQVEMLAPEVFEIKFAYLDGTELVDEWDSTEQQSLPRAVEIRLQIIEKPFVVFHQKPASKLDANRVNKKDLVEYRLLVHLPEVQPPQKIAAPRSSSDSTKNNGDNQNQNQNQNESSSNNTSNS